MTNDMTKGDRDNLAKLIRARERVAKTAATERSAHLLDAFEQQAAAEYHISDDVVWADATAVATKAVEEATRIVEQRCVELGIPEAFRPGINLHWSSRGRGAAKERVAELRRLAKVHLDAAEKSARTQIERHSVELQTRLLAGGLESAEAVEFLASMPTVEELMPAAPALAMLELEAGDRKKRW